MQTKRDETGATGPACPDHRGHWVETLSDLSPFEILFDDSTGEPSPLTDELTRLYGALRFPRLVGSKPHVIASFVETLDGVVALRDGGKSGGAEISGGSRHDRLVLGLLRAAADVIVVGAGTVRASPRHRWTLDNLVPELADELLAVRARLGKPPVPSLAIVSGSGEVDPEWPLFRTADDRALVVTTARGARRLTERITPSGPRVSAVSESGEFEAAKIIAALRSWREPKLILLEGGPRLLGRFLAERWLDELFLTLAPQLAGRHAAVARLGLIEGHSFAPLDPRWARLVTLKRVESYLFARYAFDRDQSQPI